MNLPEIVAILHQAGLENAKQLRQDAAQGIKETRRRESNDPDFVVDSTMEDYEKKIRILPAILEYVKHSPTPQTILEIGGGTFRALNEMAQSPMGEGLTFSGTGLQEHDGWKAFVGKIFKSSAEKLSRIRNDSIGGLLGIQSIGFSKRPELVAAVLQLKVAQEGIVVASFKKKPPAKYSPAWGKIYTDWKYQTHDTFSQTLTSLGWDVAILPGRDGNDVEDDVVVAVKTEKRGVAQKVIDEGLAVQTARKEQQQTTTNS